MRIWDQVSPRRMCRQHLLGEHRELHGLWNILQRGSAGTGARNPEQARERFHATGGYANHPETLRWVGYRPALLRRHNAIVREMERRGYNHHSPILGWVPGIEENSFYPHIEDNHAKILFEKNCECEINGDVVGIGIHDSLKRSWS